MRNIKKAFTMIELIFVIVIMGILAKFGVEFLTTAYSGFINSKINNQLQQNSASALEFVGARLQYRIKASTIAREDNGTFTPIKEYYNQTANILEWVGYDIEGYRGDSNGTWSGVIDLNSTATDLTQLTSLRTDTNDIDNLINALSNGTTGVDDTAIYFVDPDALEDNASFWGWDMNAATTQAIFNTQNNLYIHPVKQDPGDLSLFLPIDSFGNDNNFSGVTPFEFYQLAWTAYAVGIDDYNTTAMGGDNVGNLTLWYDYQPWQGDTYLLKADGITATKKAVIMQNVSSFRFIARESVIKIQVCVKSLLLTDEEYSVCKEKTIF